MSGDSIDIKCTSCGGLAKFEEPFLFIDPKKIPDDIEYKLWGGWGIIEKFPSDVKWVAPSGSSQYLRGGGDNGQGGYPLLTFGLIQCGSCHKNIKHKLNWPSDAYWQWSVKGEILWAWDRSHANQILKYIEANIRPSRKCYSLKYIPTHFLSSKVKSGVVKQMVRSLNT
ncbi:hypothetical protein [Catenovulum maritimum]|uniref:Uncharacterized protein n=1 Tax=Catenovulum maritimum TaxID=1513271 RepID=A0A0J8GSQ2_9ALTE|nr:hypothetical protein [Catenovulum maritimum]KMT63733.1 hypothetical protein XM47_18095 [Catenovulum maritimum]